MARTESKMIMGYLPIEPRHYPALLSLVTPATPAVKLLDPFAGEGAFLEAAAQAWNVTPYANELDGERAAQCIERFGPKQAVRCDVERLLASNGAFGIGWFNPPYDHDKAAKASKRVEFAYLRHCVEVAARRRPGTVVHLPAPPDRRSGHLPGEKQPERGRVGAAGQTPG